MAKINKKTHDLRLDRAILKIEKSFPSHKLTTMKNLTYLLKPQIFKELSKSQQSKVMIQVKENCMQALKELSHVMQFLPKKQCSEILTSNQFEYFMRLVQDFRFLDKKIENEFAQTLYSNFVQIGLRGIANSMPRQFNEVIRDMVQPILKLLVAISETEIKDVPKLTEKWKREVLD